MIDPFLVGNQFPGESLTLLPRALNRFGNCFSTWETTTTTTMNEITDIVAAEATAMVVVNGRRLNRILRRRWNVPRTHLLLI
jgi:hypothetical protein